MSAAPENPFADGDAPDPDRVLVERALEGERQALEQLVDRHQPFVFNLAFKMFGSREDAEDLTQEVFVKVITSLRTFRHDSALRTWLYRITVNHFLKTRRRGLERSALAFPAYFDVVASTEDLEPNRDAGVTDEVIEELRLRCTTGMLMCLDRDQRLAFILGAMFGASHVIAGEVLGISPGNFRVRLHRARRDLASWMNARCGLVNEANPCRCRRKTTAYVRQGLVDPKRLVFNADYVVRIDTLTRARATETMEVVDELHERVFRSHPLSVDRTDVVGAILGDDRIRSFFALE